MAVLAFVALAAGLDGPPPPTASGAALVAALTRPSPAPGQSARSGGTSASSDPSVSTSAELPRPDTGPSPLDRWRPDRRSTAVTAATGSFSGTTTPPSPGRDKPGDEEKHDGETTPPSDSGDPGDSASVWEPPTPLPAPPSGTRPVDVVLSPHPDDETLSLGVWVADAVAHGHRVIVVSLTDGRSTGAITSVSAKLRRKVTRDEIGAARIRELRAASAALGIAPGDVYAAQCDAEKSAAGSRVTVPEARAVVEAFAERFPNATFATMSWVAERHADHLAAGEALRDATELGVVRHSVFAISRLWWSLRPPSRTTDLVPATPAIRRRVLAASAAYQLWDPAHKRYSIGWLSVHKQFRSLQADPRTRVHNGPAAVRPGIEP